MATETLTDLIVRPATQDDIPKLEQFIAPFVEKGKLLRRTVDELADLLDEFLVAVLDGEIVGCAALEVYSPKLAEIRSLAVSPTVQGMGVGRHLVDACVARARDLRILEVMAITSSEAFFLACGFDFTLPGEKKALFIQTREEL
jgi:amino-acid N-acetyltransferase